MTPSRSTQSEQSEGRTLSLHSLHSLDSRSSESSRSTPPREMHSLAAAHDEAAARRFIDGVFDVVHRELSRGDRTRGLVAADRLTAEDLLSRREQQSLRISSPQALPLTCGDAGCGRGVVAASDGVES